MYDMNSKFDKVLNGLRVTIPDFDLSSFTSKDIVSPKAQHILAGALFSRTIKDKDVKFSMTTRQKDVFGCLQATHIQNFLFAIPIDRVGQHMSPVTKTSPTEV